MGKQKQERLSDRSRSKSKVRFRLSREGVNFVLILLFILIGAVLRDISLLVILAGVMIALLLIQWRLGKRTITHLEVRRELLITAICELPIDVRVTVYNRRKLLGAWLLTVEDQVERVLPERKLCDRRAMTLVDNVAPGHHRQSTYQLVFHQRGHYRVGPTTLSTRYPLNLGNSSQLFSDYSSIIVHPRQGALTTRCNELFRIERQGLSRTIARAGVSEGEFFGLRQWHNGDSQRWIHWRTTARLGELSVRQFEQQQRLQSVLILDLFSRSDEGSLHLQNAAEKAISFVATLAVELVGRGRHKMSVGIAGKEVRVLPNVQSPVMVNDLLDHLAGTSTRSTEALPEVLEKLQSSLFRSPFLIVVSTRSNVLSELIRSMPDSPVRRMLERIGLRWINVSADDLESFFEWREYKWSENQWSESKSPESVGS